MTERTAPKVLVKLTAVAMGVPASQEPDWMEERGTPTKWPGPAARAAGVPDGALVRKVARKGGFLEYVFRWSRIHRRGGGVEPETQEEKESQ